MAHSVAKKLITLFLLEPRPSHYKLPDYKLFIQVSDFSALLANMVNEATDECTASTALSILQTNLNAYGYNIFRSKILGEQLVDVMVMESILPPPLDSETATVGDIGFIRNIEREHHTPFPATIHHPGALDTLVRNPNAYIRAHQLLSTRG